GASAERGVGSGGTPPSAGDATRGAGEPSPTTGTSAAGVPCRGGRFGHFPAPGEDAASAGGRFAGTRTGSGGSRRATRRDQRDGTVDARCPWAPARRTGTGELRAAAATRGIVDRSSGGDRWRGGDS